MTYWFPPLPKDFDPVPRPLLYSGSRRNAIPSAIDAEIFGTNPNDPNWYPDGAMRGDIGSQGALAVAIGGHAPNKPGSNPWFWNQRTAAERLDYYRKLAQLQADGDPPDGGLPADSILYDVGGIQIHYWDLAETPRRKSVTWTPDGKSRVFQWNAEKSQWEGEGWDFNAAVDIGTIVGVFGAVTTAAIGYLSANPALAGAWSNLFKVAAAPITTGKAPDLGAFALSAAQVFGAVPNFGQAMGDAIVGDGLKKGLMGEVGTFAYREVATIGNEVSTHLDRIKAAVEKAADAFPRVDLSAMANGTIPADVMKAWQNSLKGLASFDLFSYQKAAFTVAQGLETDALQHLLYAIRKAAPDKPTYDVTVASAFAQKKKDSSRAVVESWSTIGVGKPATVHSDSTARRELDTLVKSLQKRYQLR